MNFKIQKMKNIMQGVVYGRLKVCLVSYPKTGRTWLRTLIGKSLSEMYDLPEEKLLDTRFMTTKSGLLPTEFTHDDSMMKFKKPYYELNSIKSEFKNKKVILVGRNVKDTLVSAYFQATKRIKIYDGSISEFIRDDVFGALKIITFYKIWYENRHLPKEMMFITYEDMHKDIKKTLNNVLKVIGAENIDPEILKTSIEYSSFDNLKKAEKSNKFKNPILSPSDINDEESYKARKGKVGNYREYLNQDDIMYVDNLLQSSQNCNFLT